MEFIRGGKIWRTGEREAAGKEEGSSVIYLSKPRIENLRIGK